jgi:hypothetical protein
LLHRVSKNRLVRVLRVCSAFFLSTVHPYWLAWCKQCKYNARYDVATEALLLVMTLYLWVSYFSLVKRLRAKQSEKDGHVFLPGLLASSYLK